MTDVHVDGVCDDRYARMRATFEQNFSARDELGAAVCVYADGRKVVDLWGGHLDPARQVPWVEDTVVCMASVTKGMTALCLHLLVERGEVDLDAPMARYWLAFAQAGKAAITVRQTVGHKDGMIYNDAASAGDWLDRDRIAAAIAAQAPAWEPGTRGAYNSFNYGYLLGEIIRRVDGRTPGEFFRDEIALPLDIDYRIGVPEQDLDRVSNLYPNPESTTLNAFRDPATKLARAWHSLPADTGELGPLNLRDYRTGDFPSGNGIGNARAVAKVFAALAGGGSVDGIRLWQPDTVERMREEQWDGICGLTDRPFRMGLGLFLNSPPLLSMGPNARAFGHMGAGGAFAFADPEAGLAFAYSPNFMCEGAGVGARCDALVDALYADA
ncbi:MAG: beta-lactamase family protein [Alphaproteobacteria bacterium]|nr:beta-lactamase family protein [Alphaproteobacteria bacterium]